MMTIQQIIKAAQKYPYIRVRYKSGKTVGVNTKVIRLIKTYKNTNNKTAIVSYSPISFQEYISAICQARFITYSAIPTFSLLKYHLNKHINQY